MYDPEELFEMVCGAPFDPTYYVEYLENKFGVRIEDMIYMSEDGPKNITMTPKRLIEI